MKTLKVLVTTVCALSLLAGTLPLTAACGGCPGNSPERPVECKKKCCEEAKKAGKSCDKCAKCPKENKGDKKQDKQ